MAVKGFLISEAWAKRVDETIRRDAAAFLSQKTPAPSRFYDLRPITLASAWTLSGSVWTATGRFVSGGPTYPIYAPAADSDPGGIVDASTFFVAWRGRWETTEKGGTEAAKKGVRIKGLNSSVFLRRGKSILFPTGSVVAATNYNSEELENSYFNDGLITLSYDAGSPASYDIPARTGILKEDLNGTGFAFVEPFSPLSVAPVLYNANSDYRFLKLFKTDTYNYTFFTPEYSFSKGSTCYYLISYAKSNYTETGLTSYRAAVVAPLLGYNPT